MVAVRTVPQAVSGHLVREGRVQLDWPPEETNMKLPSLVPINLVPFSDSESLLPTLGGSDWLLTAALTML